jgi:hypothetical protein
MKKVRFEDQKDEISLPNHNFEYLEDFEEFDINDFMIPDDEQPHQSFVDLLNVFICYSKQLFHKGSTSHMFENIDFDKDDSTNRYMEYLFEEITIFNHARDGDKDVLYLMHDFKNDNHKLDLKYALYIDDELTYGSKYLLPMIKHLTTLKWQDINWRIIPFG